jgi:hypothetical protein
MRHNIKRKEGKRTLACDKYHNIIMLNKNIVIRKVLNYLAFQSLDYERT